ncbi:MAG: MFS transporter [Alphaproteobacteria bacterium]
MIENRWLMLAVLFAARTAIAVQFQTVASSSASLIAALAIDFTSLGLLIGLYMSPGIVISLPGGVLGQRFGAKQIALLGLALMVAGGVMMGLSASYAAAAIGRVVAGTGAVFFNVLVTKMIADWFASREIVIAMGTLVSSWPFGLALAIVGFAPVAAAHGFAPIMHLGALAALIALALVAMFYRDPPDMPDEGAARLSLDLTRREWVLVIIAGLIWAFSNVSYIVMVSFAPELFTQRSFTPVQAGWIVSLFGWSLIPSIPLWSFIAARIGRPNLMMHGSFAITSGALVALALSDSMLVPVALIILFNGVPPGQIMALPAQVLRPQSRAGGMGVFFTVYYAAMAVLPGGAGLARDLTGSAAAPVLFAATMMVACIAALSLFVAAERVLRR